MTPHEKAIELVKKFKHFEYADDSQIVIHKSPFKAAKQCALTAVDEILELAKVTDSIIAAVDKVVQKESGKRWSFVDYWQQVKQEIEKL